MLKKVLLVLLPVLAFLGGSAGGSMVKAPPAGASDSAGPGADPGPGSAGDPPPGETGAAGGAPTAAAEAGHGGGEGGVASGDGEGGGEGGGGSAGFFAFPNQFFVPVVRNGNTDFVIILSVTLETPKDAEAEVQALEHRLRDSLLRQLIIHANTGGFDGNFTSDVHLRTLREALLGAARSVAGDKVQAVLIGDIARKED